MKLRIEDITAQVKELDFNEPEKELNRVLEMGPIREYRVDGPLAVHLSHYRAGLELFFEGRLSARVTAVCARCTEEFDVSQARDFRFVLAPKAAGELNTKNLDAEDLEFSLYDGEEVDVSPLIREQLLLALPTRPLCQEECRGLCPNCGANLNLGACGCTTQIPDPRLEVLRSLKISRS